MKQSLLTIIAVLVAITLAMFSIDTAGYQYSSRSYRTYSYHPDPDTRSGDGDETPSLLRMDNTDDSSLPMVETITNESFPPLMISNSPLGTPPAMLETSAMAELTPSQLPPLDAGMVNVTGGFDENMQTAGYRVNPMPGEFAIAVPYDPELLPQGFTEDDIQTYVYDRQYHRWVAIQRDSVNEAELLVCSRFRPWEKGLSHTRNDLSNPQDALAQVQDMMSLASQGNGDGDSPLDFINAVLKTPEMPETSAYTPTSIKELKAADPLEGITLIQPPTANNSGTANLSYPIEIPAGRQGMQPNLALTYSSSGGNGWLGVGWDISIPSITVETRWGVPRYRTAWESEVYLYEGEQLVTKDNVTGGFRKLAHRTNDTLSISRLSGNIQHFPRKNEAYDSIVRHGSGPDSYWWTVTHKNGVTDYYGKYASDNGVNNSCVLRTGADNTSGAIAHWALAESVDPYGNSVRYYYSVVFENVGITDGAIGKQIYIESVSYTNTSLEPGKYKVIFNRRDRERQDVIISANRGFAEVSAASLCNIGVFYNDTTVREYMFFDTLSRCSNYKTRLTDVVRIDRINAKPLGCVGSMSNLAEENTTRSHFDYFDSPQGDGIFGEEHRIDLNDDNVGSWFLTNPASLGNDGKSTALGSTRGKSWNIGGTVSVGVGPNVALTSVSVGGNFNYSRSKSEGALTLIDLDGDGLADKVFKVGKQLFYRPQIAIDDTTFEYGDTMHISGLTDFLRETSSTTTWGLQASALLAYNGSWPTTKSTTTNYFSDVNADGLPDLITDDGVMFNVTEPGGRVRFRSFYTIMAENQNAGTAVDSNVVYTSVDTCQGIIFDGEASDSIICFIRWVRDTAFNAKSYNDLMPQQVLDFVDSLESTDEYYCEYRYSAQPSRVTDIIVYRKEMECLPIFSQTANSNIVTIPDPDLEAVKVWVPQKAGTVSIRSRLRLLNDSIGGMSQSKWRDGVSYAVQVCRGVTADNDYVLHATSYDTLFSRHVNKDDTSMKDTTFSVYVGLNDLVFFRLISGDNHDFDKVSWQQTITYSGSGSLDQYGVNENYYDSKRDFVVSGRDFFAVPLDEDSSYIRVSADIYTTTPYSNNNNSGYRLRIEALRMNNNNHPTTIASENESIRNNTQHTQIFLKKNGSQYIPVQQEDFVKFTLEKRPITLNSQQFDWSKVQIVPHVEYYQKRNGEYVKIQDYYPPVKAEIENYDGTKKDTVYHTLFGPLYRGWGQFAYNNNDTANGATIHDTHIRLEKLVTDLDMYPHDSTHAENGKNKINQFKNHLPEDSLHPQEASYMVSCYENAGVYNPIAKATSWIEMRPDCKNRAWVGYGNINYLTDSIMSNTRLPEYSADTNTIDIEEYDHPIPIVNNHEVKTVRKQNISRIKNHSFSLSPIPVISVGMTCSRGENIILTDYMDLNGDRYPDIVGPSLVQYSNPWGGIGNPVPMGPMADGITKSETTSGGVNFGGSFQMPTRGASNNPKGSKISFDGSGNVGADLGGGSDNTVFSWMDVNGDGLPDKVSVDSQGNAYISLNTGYGLQTKTLWGNFPIRDGDSENASMSLGANFNVGQASIGGGMGVNFSRNHTQKMLMDFNGDGLPDYVMKGGKGLTVCYNIGGGNWSGWENVNSVSNISFGRSYSESINASVTLGFTFWSILKVCAGISGSPYSKSFSRDSVQIIDINGDGYVDYVTSDSENEMTVRYNKSGKTNLLRKVTNFTGSSFEMDYDMPLACYEKPQRSWNLAEVRVYNDDTLCPVGGNRTHTTFEYLEPKYNRVERMDYGYHTVITYQHDTENHDNLYKLTVEEFNNQDFTKRGRKIRDCMYDAEWNPYIEHLYDVIVYDFADSEVSEGGCVRADVYVGVESDLTNWYEGNSTAQVTSRVVRRYDRYRNVTEYIHYGDTAHHDEWFKAEIEYATGMPHNLALPVQIIVKDHNGNVMQKRTASYYPTGKLQQLVRHNSGGDAQYDFTYDTYGNLSSAVMPQNLNGQRLQFTYQYDTSAHTYPVRVDNVSLGFFSTASYDLKFGKPTRTVDINGNEMRYQYDSMGRCTTIVAPYEIDSGRPYTIRMEYHPKNYGTLNISGSGGQSYACTYHYDCQHQSDPIKTTVIADGLGRMMQTKKDAEINGNEWSLVTGKVKYDCFGRTIEQYHPFKEDTALFATYNSYYVPETRTSMEYDIMNRQTKVKLPTSDSTVMSYGVETWGGKKLLRTVTEDAKGNQVKVLTGTIGQQIVQIDPYGSETSFEYDCLGQLRKSTDPDGFETTYDYDMVGQLVLRKHPDAGEDSYEYDPAGNLTLHKNAAGEQLDYRYHYNQLTDVLCSLYPANNVHYEYGTYNNTNLANNSVGKITRQEDASGWQTFKYGKLGETIENIRTFAVPFDAQIYTFRMNFEYDSWNRIQSMTYPDGEVVHYGYNPGGMLKSVSGTKMNHSYPYIDSIRYNEFELKEDVWYGNGAQCKYGYDILQRLSGLQSYTASNELMQNISYTYDEVGNITDIDNSAGILSNGLGGPYFSSYQYDSLYRLVHSDGNWLGSPNAVYELATAYHPNGRIKRKALSADIVIQTPMTNSFNPVEYDNMYHYTNSSQPNTLTYIDNGQQQEFVWDAKGNMVYHKHDGIPMKRFLCWDEQNRLQGVMDEQSLAVYQYDANGDRTYKLTGELTSQNVSGTWNNFYLLDKATLYASPYLVVTPKGYTKHYYAESERVASKLGNGGLLELDYPLVDESLFHVKRYANTEHAQNVVDKCLHAEDARPSAPLSYLYELMEVSQEPENERYWYHPDHLGSSSWITFSDGEAVQHLHYLPFGEDLVNQQHTVVGAMYTFSAKEKDAETGYSYFGSRYYNSDLSIWLSVDPMASKYPHQSNYVYCSNNPIKVIDPNGEDEYEFDEYGCYIRTISNTQADIIHIVNGDGERTASSQGFSYGSIISQPNNDVPSNNSTLPDATMFQVVDEGTASAIFEFFSENTSVEWGNVSAETKDNGCEYTIGTNHMEGKNNISAIVTNQGAVVDRSAHNHPNDINSVSDGDHRGAIILEQINPNVQLFNYTRKHGYTQYNRNTGYVDKNGVSHYPLREVIIDKKP